MRQKAQRGLGISVFREEKVNGLPRLIHRSIHVPPLAFDPKVGLVQAPAAPDRALAVSVANFAQGAMKAKLATTSWLFGILGELVHRGGSISLMP